MAILINIKSNNKNSLKRYVFFFKKIISKFAIILIKQQNNRIKKKTFSVLRSPHVNSRSGEHFMYNVYQVNIKFILNDLKLFVFFIKKIKQNLYSDVVITIKRDFKVHPLNKKFLGIYDPDKGVISNKSIVTYFKSWDNFGEFCFRSNSTFRFSNKI